MSTVIAAVAEGILQVRPSSLLPGDDVITYHDLKNLSGYLVLSIARDQTVYATARCYPAQI